MFNDPFARSVAGVLLTTTVLAVAPLAGRWASWITQDVSAFAATDGAGTIGSPGDTVLVIGGSESGGWGDHGQGGFILRAFATLSSSTTDTFQINNHSIPGANSTQLDTIYQGRYNQWLTSIHPTVVVIAWGLLNDAHPHTSFTSFSTDIQTEIQRALDQQAVVFIVTPPVTKASYEQYPIAEQKYVDAELRVAQSFHNPNVEVFNVFDQMKRYIAVHHQTYLPYMADGWHPNSAGHQLAASILSADVASQFSQRPIQFQK